MQLGSVVGCRYDAAMIRVWVEIMGPGKCGIVGKSQWVLIMIDPVVSTRTRRMRPGGKARLTVPPELGKCCASLDPERVHGCRKTHPRLLVANIIEAPWPVNSGHGASLRHHIELISALQHTIDY
eukprot:COSAG01_NODE_6280_length_3755_cov_33.946663_3_plen_125_part_00